jgi:hypothetical protein
MKTLGWRVWFFGESIIIAGGSWVPRVIFLFGDVDVADCVVDLIAFADYHL